MPDFKIVRTRKDGADVDRRIDAVMLANGSIYDVDRIIAAIKAGDRFWTFVAPGPSAWVYVQRHWLTKREYITTSADGLGINNLLKLPDC